MPVLDTLPPGVKYTLQGLPNTLVAPALVLVSAMLARNHLHIFLPIWAVIVAAGLSLPIGWLVKVKYRDWVDARDAAALGAVMPPVVYDPWPGSLSLFRMAVDDFKNGYAGVYYYGFRLHNLFDKPFKAICSSRCLRSTGTLGTLRSSGRIGCGRRIFSTIHY